ncbi:MAG: CshA/CshB family fibrillar adhesin-related protein [Actinomycetaceae bacterium]|nr:CshA/CshB family fibrillar adhesin-related protein [Actinomycetaceae bacterium]
MPTLSTPPGAFSARPAGNGRRNSTRWARLGRHLSATLAAIFFSGTMTSIAPAPPAHAVMATPDGGVGKFEQVIDWIDWTDGGEINIPDGSTHTTWSTPTPIAPDLYRASHCTISNVTSWTSGATPDRRATTNAFIKAGYQPGSWHKDALARLYNDGTNYSNGVEKPGRNQRQRHSGLPIGLSTSARITNNFSIGCRTYIIQSATTPTKNMLDGLPKQEIAINGVVVADAESSNWGNGNEWITAIPQAIDPAQPTTTRFLESLRTPGCTTNSWAGVRTQTLKNGVSGQGVQLRPDAPECHTYGPASVLFFENANGGHFEVAGGGSSAMAMGVVVNIDFGDAPESYGTAGSAFQPSWAGGALGADIPISRAPVAGGNGNWFNLSAAQAGNQGAESSSATVALGSLTDHDADPHGGDGAIGDDHTGEGGQPTTTSDEDALGSWDKVIVSTAASQWSLAVNCSGSGLVGGWVDWNRNGSFEDTEGSNQVVCEGGMAQLKWTIPADAKRSIVAERGSAATYMRLRMSDDSADGTYLPLKPTGITLSGEVEDHPVEVRVPALTLVNEVDNTHAGTLGLKPEEWTLEATDTASQVVASGKGRIEAAAMDSGDHVLSATSDHAFAPGYDLTGIECRPHPDSIVQNPTSTFNADTKTLTLQGQDWMLCTVKHVAKPGTLTWTKIDSLHGFPLDASSWHLKGTGIPAGTEVFDCVGEGTCLPGPFDDRDDRSGYFRVENVPWGTDFTLSENNVPFGYVPIGGELELSPIDGAHLESTLVNHPNGVPNDRLKGSVSWKKTDPEGNPLGGSSWFIWHAGIPGGTTVEDCVADSPTQCLTFYPYDSDPAPGSFSVEGLDWDWAPSAIQEARAPEGYLRDDTQHVFDVTGGANFVFDQPMVNHRINVPAIPLTGGMAEDIYRYGGGGVLVAAAIGGFIAWKKRRQSA